MRFWMLVAAVGLSAGPAAATEPLDGWFIALEACEAFQSKNKQTNPGEVMTEPMRAYAMRGAFTDARTQKRGLLEQADEGTVFLDEIGEMAPALQAKLLRFLEEKAFRRVGGSGDIHVDVRVIAATNRELEDLVRSGKFRDDLFYRLNVLRLEVPPLRARREDIPLLAQYYIELYAREFKRPVRGLTHGAEAALTAYSWPGNVRELRNLVERAVLLAEGDRLTPADFESLHTARSVTPASQDAFALPPEGVNLEDVERRLVVQALDRVGGNQTRAAALLGLHRDQIRYRIEKFGLKKSETATAE
jgi:DNA-binding NtrC family response regulator